MIMFPPSVLPCGKPSSPEGEALKGLVIYMKQKRAVAINDISCMGKCSLTVALPIISAMGIETVVLPTAVLSTHTAFEGFTFCDLTEEIGKTQRHWESLNAHFDCIYSGYLGSFTQISLVEKFIESFKAEDTLVVIDPVLGDNGQLYKNFTVEFAAQMAKLCAKADVITPNLTEAAYLLNRSYIGDGYTEEDIKELLIELSKLGAKKVVLTGISFDRKRLGVAMYDSLTGEYSYYKNERISSMFHGTGDVWASTFTGALVRGYDFEKSAQIATDFTVDCIKATLDDKEEHWYGVKFEQCLPSLVKEYA